MGPIREHLRSNVIGYVALFFVFTGGAYALQGKNTVNSGDIKPKNVKKSDLAPNSVDSSKVVDGSLTGDDVDESTLNGFLASGAQAGGDLGGPFANLQIGPGAVGSTEVAADSLGASEIDESSLAFVNGANLDMYFGRAQLNAGPPAQVGDTPIISIPGVFEVKGERVGADMGSTQCAVGFENTSGGALQYSRFSTSTADSSVDTAGGEIMSSGSGDDVDLSIAAGGYARWLVGRTPNDGAPLVISAEASWSLNSGRCNFQATATVGGA